MAIYDCIGRCDVLRVKALPFFEIARVLVRLDHVASFIVNANHFIVRVDERLIAFVELQLAIRVGLKAAI